MNKETYNFEVKKIYLNKQGGYEVSFTNVNYITALTLTKMSHNLVETKSDNKQWRCWTYTNEGLERLRRFIQAMVAKDPITEYYLTTV